MNSFNGNEFREKLILFIEELKTRYSPDIMFSFFLDYLDSKGIAIPAICIDELKDSRNWLARNYFYRCLLYSDMNIRKNIVFEKGMEDDEFVVVSSALECLDGIVLTAQDRQKLKALFNRKRNGIIRRDIAIVLGQSSSPEVLHFLQEKIKTCNDWQTRIGLGDALLRNGDSRYLTELFQFLSVPESSKAQQYLAALQLSELSDYITQPSLCKKIIKTLGVIKETSTQKCLFLAYFRIKLHHEKEIDSDVSRLVEIFRDSAIRQALLRALIEDRIRVNPVLLLSWRNSQNPEEQKLFFDYLHIFSPEQIAEYCGNPPVDHVALVSWIKCFYYHSCSEKRLQELFSLFKMDNNPDIAYHIALALGRQPASVAKYFLLKQKASCQLVACGIYGGLVQSSCKEYYMKLAELLDSDEPAVHKQASMTFEFLIQHIPADAKFMLEAVLAVCEQSEMGMPIFTAVMLMSTFWLNGRKPL